MTATSLTRGSFFSLSRTLCDVKEGQRIARADAGRGKNFSLAQFALAGDRHRLDAKTESARENIGGLALFDDERVIMAALHGAINSGRQKQHRR